MLDLMAELPAGPIAAPGGDCQCGRGQVIGVLGRERHRLVFSSFERHGAHWATTEAANWACVDCVAEAALIVAQNAAGEG